MAIRKLSNEEIGRRDPATLADAPRHPVSVVVADIRSLYNVGAIFRTSDAMLVEHVYLTGYSPTPEHRGMHKTALGAQDTVPWSHHADAGALLDGLRERGYTIAALEITDRPTPVETLTQAHFPLALVVGNEVDGVPEALLARADVALEIEQYGAKHSLNVAVAYGIAAHALVRRARALEPHAAPRS